MVMDNDVEVTTLVLFTTASWAPGNVVAPSKTRRVSPDATLNVEMRSSIANPAGLLTYLRDEEGKERQYEACAGTFTQHEHTLALISR
jgi:hypothetical protein